MDLQQGLDQSKPPSTSYRETFRRHRKLLCMPIILGGLAAAFFLFATGKTYESSASIWVDTAPPAPSSIGANTNALAEPPAVSELAILNQLLMTRRFAASVAKTSLLGKSLGSADAIRDKAVGQLAKGQVKGTVPGGQVLQISYSAASPAMAESVLRAVITQLRDYTKQLAGQHGQAAVGYGREQVNVARAALATARSRLAVYKAQHPGVTESDPNYVSLVAAETNAATQLAEANTTLSEMTGASNPDGWSMRVIDPPSQATTAPLRKKKIVEVILGGLLAGLLVSILAVVALTPAKKEVWEDELPIGGPFVPDVPPADPVPGWSPGVPTAPAQSTPATTASGRSRLSLGDRPFQFGGPSAPPEEP
jgi:uncharacterized protein involved in exopolysaccharide biosynthesis